MEEMTQEKSDMSTIYEVSYLLLPSLAEEQVPNKAVALKEILTRLGGTVISDENPVLIDLAYPMVKVVGTTRHKVTSGYFGWIKFDIGRDIMGDVKKALDGSDDILRYLIIKTVSENTLLNGKMKFQKEEKARKDDDESAEVPEVPPEMVLEEVDKSIDALIS